ncbi:hypothetical protein BLOT_010308 [Blomia tropicalis]|nr:hypothetical protein BLOT_010308 [Blomia tropicalis]
MALDNLYQKKKRFCGSLNVNIPYIIFFFVVPSKERTDEKLVSIFTLHYDDLYNIYIYIFLRIKNSEIQD